MYSEIESLSLGERIEGLLGRAQAGPQGKRLEDNTSSDGVRTVLVEVSGKQYEVVQDLEKVNGQGWIWQVTRLDNGKVLQTPGRWDLAELEAKDFR